MKKLKISLKIRNIIISFYQNQYKIIFQIYKLEIPESNKDENKINDEENSLNLSPLSLQKS